MAGVVVAVGGVVVGLYQGQPVLQNMKILLTTVIFTIFTIFSLTCRMLSSIRSVLLTSNLSSVVMPSHTSGLGKIFRV